MKLKCFANVTKFHNNLRNIKNYTDIEADFAGLSSLNHFSECDKLKRLIISYNHISSLEGIEKLKNLQVLDISRNNIYHIKIETELPSLTNLYIEGMKILSFEGIENIPNLTEIAISYHEESIDIIKEFYKRGIRTSLYSREYELIPYKINLYKINNKKYYLDQLVDNLQKRKRRSQFRINKLYLKKKIISYWFSFFEQKRDNSNCNRLSFLSWN